MAEGTGSQAVAAVAGRLFHKESVGDLVLLDTINEDSVTNNLRVRHAADLVYTYIGNVLISVNPFKAIPGLYDIAELLPVYRGRFLYESPPHVFAIAEAAFANLKKDSVPQCIIIAGESGAGKTEASKKIMFYVSAVSGQTAEIARVNRQLLESNPILEAFGNARTLRNNNSSRFGKYLEICFDHRGEPIGGRIKTYLLEKSRVCSAGLGERSFHIFYLLLKGSDADSRRKFELKEPSFYKFLSRTNVYTPSDIASDGSEMKEDLAELVEKQNFKEVVDAMMVLGVTETEIEEIFRTLSAILWLGQIEFHITGEGSCIGKDSTETVRIASQLLKVDSAQLGNSFLKRESVVSAREKVSRILSISEAQYTRDSFVKTLYQRLFHWIVARVNISIEPGDKAAYGRSIGVLDIYGFEIFTINSFEQFCINYVNEKLQQIFIERTLKSEQEEYAREKIEWEEIPYFDNKGVCDLIEASRTGVIALLNETCMFPKGDDALFIEKIVKSFEKSKHFRKSSVLEDSDIRKKSPNIKSKGSASFVVKHYAGDVIYTVDGFVDKNKDTVWDELQRLGRSSGLSIFKDMFPPENPEDERRKRPPTASSQFKDQVTALMETLFKCEPHYVRCIKPNEVKMPKIFDETRVRHQVRYLGLVENVKVRRAGYAFRMPYMEFLKRNKMIGTKTWPHWDPAHAMEGTVHILSDINQVKGQHYQLGVTKVFIKNPNSLFKLEENRERRIQEIFSLVKASFRAHAPQVWLRETKMSIRLQSAWRMYTQRRMFVQYQASTKVQCAWKMYANRQMLVEYRKATKLQSAWRTHSVRHAMIENRAATELQACWRMFSARRMLLEYQAATRLQSVWRKSVQVRWKIQSQQATLLQSVWRGSTQRSWKRKIKMATFLQASWKAVVSRRLLSEHRAATLLQSAWRSVTPKNWFQQQKAAECLQKAWRGCVHREWLKHFQAARSIQCRPRGFKVRYWYRTYTDASKIQALAKGVLARKWYERTRAVFVIDAAWLGLLYRTFFSQSRAATFLQKAWRARIAREWFHREQASIVLQKSWRTRNAVLWIRKEKASTYIQSGCKTILAQRLAQKIRAASALTKTFRRFKELRPALLIRDQAVKLVGFKKTRRRNSLNRFFVGRYLNGEIENSNLAQVVEESKDSLNNLAFIDDVIKMNRDMQPYNRVMLITDSNIFDLERKKDKKGVKFTAHRVVPIAEVESISMSTFCDNLITLHVTTSFDQVYDCVHKIEVMALISQKLQKLKGRPPAVNIHNDFEYQIKSKDSRGLNFVAAGSNETLKEGDVKIEKDKNKKKPPSFIVHVSQVNAASTSQTERLKDVHSRI